MISVCVGGATGRVGGGLCRAIAEAADLRLVAGVLLAIRRVGALRGVVRGLDRLLGLAAIGSPGAASV